MRIVAIDSKRRYYVLRARGGDLLFKRLSGAEVRRRVMAPPLRENLLQFGEGEDIWLYQDGEMWSWAWRALRRLNLHTGHPKMVQRIIDANILMEGA